MSDTPAYILANFIINDADTYRIYEKGFFPILKKHGGEFITFDDSVEPLEGESPIQGRVVMIKFASADAARDWYNDPDYQALSEHRRAGTELRSLSIVHGMSAR
ncbi:MAG: DUF1330 domain-containing protein [Sphingomonadales bacterium]